MSSTTSRCHRPETILMSVVLFMVQSATAGDGQFPGMWTAFGISFAIFFFLSVFISCFKACLIRRRMQQLNDSNGRHIVVAVIPYGADGRPRRPLRRAQMRLATLPSGRLAAFQPPPSYDQTMQNVNTPIPPYNNEPPPAYEPTAPPTHSELQTRSNSPGVPQQPVPATNTS